MKRKKEKKGKKKKKKKKKQCYKSRTRVCDVKRQQYDLNLIKIFANGVINSID